MKDVILVDDELWALKDLARMIERHPLWRVAGQFTDSGEAIEAILICKPDLVVTDLRMSGLSGRDIINVLHQKAPDVPVVIVSAYSDFDVAREALSRNVVDYLLKPVSQESLYEILDRLDETTAPPDVETVLSDGGKTARDAAIFGVNAVLSCGREWDGRVWIEWLEKEFPRARLTLFKTEDGWAALASMPEEKYTENLPGIQTGMSRFRESFDEPGEMLEEARISRVAGFSYSSNELAARVQSYLALNYRRQITLDAIASQLFVARTHMCDVFSLATGTTIVAFLTGIRISMAKRLLVETKLSIAEIGEQVGYSDSAYFSRVFKRAVHQSPESYRRMMTGGKSSLRE